MEMMLSLYEWLYLRRVMIRTATVFHKLERMCSISRGNILVLLAVQIRYTKLIQSTVFTTEAKKEVNKYSSAAKDN